MYDDLIVERIPPPNRVGKCSGAKERHLTEAAVMLAYGMHILQNYPDVSVVELRPDGEHGKNFKIKEWLSARGFEFSEPHGTTDYCGRYVREQQAVLVECVAGKCDVVAETKKGRIVAECKGGIVNTRHGGQCSRLRKGLCEAIGLLMTLPKGGRQVAVVPHTKTTLQLAQKVVGRANEAGIEIALVDDMGTVTLVVP